MIVKETSDISITKIDDKLIVSLNSDMDDRDMERLIGIITKRVYKSEICGVILNFSMVKLMNSYIYNVFKRISDAIELMGANVVWVGLRPGVVVSLMDLELVSHADQIRTGMNIEDGLRILSEEKIENEL